MTTQSLSTAPVGLFRCHNEKYDDKVVSLYSQVFIPVPGSARLGKYCHLILPNVQKQVVKFHIIYFSSNKLTEHAFLKLRHGKG